MDEDGNGTAIVTLDSSASLDPEGDSLLVAWTLGAETLSIEPVATLDLPVGVHQITLTVTDSQGATGVDEVTVTASLLRPPSD